MAVHTQDIVEAYHDAIPLNRYGTEREIANDGCGLYLKLLLISLVATLSCNLKIIKSTN